MPCDLPCKPQADPQRARRAPAAALERAARSPTARPATRSSRTSCCTGSRRRSARPRSTGTTRSGSARSRRRCSCCSSLSGGAAAVPLRAVGRARLRLGQGHRVRRDVRLVDPLGAPHRGAPHGRGGVPAPGARVPDRRLQERRRAGAAARVELGDRRRDAAADAVPLVHRLPAAVGPARLLGGHRRHQHRLVGPGRRADDPRAADRRPRDRPADADPLLRAARHRAAGRARRALRVPHVARAQGRRPGPRRPRGAARRAGARRRRSPTKTYTLLGVARGHGADGHAPRRSRRRTRRSTRCRT